MTQAHVGSNPTRHPKKRTNVMLTNEEKIQLFDTISLWLNSGLILSMDVNYSKCLFKDNDGNIIGNLIIRGKL